jgi:hypothetical protein
MRRNNRTENFQILKQIAINNFQDFNNLPDLEKKLYNKQKKAHNIF